MPDKDPDQQVAAESAPNSPGTPEVNFVNRVTGTVRITGEEPIEETS